VAGLGLLGAVQDYAQSLFYGVVLVIAVVLSRLVANRRRSHWAPPVTGRRDRGPARYETGSAARTAPRPWPSWSASVGGSRKWGHDPRLMLAETVWPPGVRASPLGIRVWVCALEQ
jgi:hypothetical protein